jgi:stearoyl-CoA desaturase (delta-9 desaturase)
MVELLNAEITKTNSPIPNPEATGQSVVDGRWMQGLEWPAVLWIGGLHLGALAAPFCFTWQAVFMTIVLSWMTGGLGVCLGYHRLLTHSSFETFPWMKRLLAWCGMMAGEGPPIMWVATHRKHHCFSDQEADPHSPRHGRWWSHMLWMLPRYKTDQWAKLYGRYAPDLLRDRFLRFLNKTFLLWQLLVGATFFVGGWLIWDLSTGVSLLVYGMFVRLVYVMHVTWLINSATHIWGYRNYNTNDDSRNLWWVALLAYGEGWHNNHHAQQRTARHGHRWWELDLTWMTIRLMRTVGLAWNVVELEKHSTPPDSPPHISPPHISPPTISPPTISPPTVR